MLVLAGGCAVPPKWILQPVLPRPDFFTKEIRRLLHGGMAPSWPA
jgi:hypothetical protein